MTRGWMPAALVALAGCAYYNGIYNSKAAAHTADGQVHRGEPLSATLGYIASASKAETVLARYPKSHWRAEALYLAGRGLAYGGNCAAGLQRLDQYLTIAGEPADRRDRALIARASCLIYANQLLSADTILRSLLESRDAEVRGDAALWAGRAALQLGDVARAAELLAMAPRNSASWEFLTAALAKGDVATAESLLTTRAHAGDWRPEVAADIRTLWGSGERGAAIRIVDVYGNSGAPTTARAGLHLLASDLAADASDTTVARVEATAALGIGVAPTVEAEARVRLLLLRIRELDALVDVDALVARDSARVAGTALSKRLNDDLLLIHFFMKGPNIAGAGVFHAAELARDSLRAYRLSHALFRSIERDFPEYQLSGRALLASRLLFPESTKVYEARIQKNWPDSYAAVVLSGGDLDSSTFRAEDLALTRSFTTVMAQWDSVLKARKTADSLAALKGIGRQ